MDESAKMRQDILARLEEQNTMAEANISSALGQEDKVLLDTKLTVRDASMKQWTLNLLEEHQKEFKSLIKA